MPAITELSYLDPSGKEQLRLSRLVRDAVGNQADFSQDPKFRGAKSGKTYVSSVSFRQDSIPYLTIAMATSGVEAGVVAAEVNLKLIREVISQIKIGETGHAYVVDEHGHLIAHPDMSLVLQKRDLSSLPQVQAARAGPAKPGEARDEMTIARDVQGRGVLTASAAVAALGWVVFVEQPLGEALAPLYASLLRTAWLLLLGLALSVSVSLCQPPLCAEDGDPNSSVADRGSPNWGRGARPSHRGPHRRRAGVPRRPVQSYGRLVAAVLCGPRRP